MLAPRAADTDRVINRLLVATSVACCALVLASFALFARDQMAGASKHQQNELASGAPITSSAPVAVHHAQHQPRRFIDGAASTLTSPFRSIVNSDSQWVLHAVPTAFALLLYGAGLGYLARFSRGLS
jgi:hypothetical protein